MQYPRNTAVVVVEGAPFHSGRFGVVDFYGTGPSEGTVVLVDPKQSSGHRSALFAVKDTDIIPYLKDK